MSAPGRDRRRSDLGRILDACNQLGVPDNPNASERTVWVILRRHGTREGATRALKALGSRFVDVNEFRAAKPTEIAELIGPHVRNDPVSVAHHAHAFLRRLFVDHYTVTFEFADELTPDGIWKVLSALEDSAQEIALGMLLHFCGRERQVQAQEKEEGRRRPERELTVAANRLRLLFAFATLGTKTRRTKITLSPRGFLKAWEFRPLPVPGGERKPAARKKTAARPAAKKGATKKTATQKRPARKTAKGARPRTSRTARTRAATKKSSRR